jgi:seryl-tRNA synthetase
MSNLEKQWISHKQPLEDERERLRQELNNKKLLIQQKIEETRQFKQEIDELNAELTAKDSLIKELNKEMENIPKESIKTSNRQFYTKRILEIVANIDKQKKEIDKVIKKKNIFFHKFFIKNFSIDFNRN